MVLLKIDHHLQICYILEKICSYTNNQFYNDLDKSKTDINYHWDEIQKKVSTTISSNGYNLPPIVKIRQYCNVSVTVVAKKTKWVAVQKTKSNQYIMNDNNLLDYVMKNALDNGDYVCIGAAGGLETNNASQISVNAFTDAGIRLYNNSSKDINTVTTVERNNGSEGEGIEPGSAKTCPPFLDLLYIRKDIIDYCY